MMDDQRLTMLVASWWTLLWGLTAAIGHAQSEPGPPAEFRVEQLASSLANPSSLAVQPRMRANDDWEVLVCENLLGRVVRIRGDRPGSLEVVVDGLPKGETSSGPSSRAGPQAIAFLGGKPDFLVVTDTSSDGQPSRVRVFRLAAGGPPVDAAAAIQDLSLPSDDGDDAPSYFADLTDNGVALFTATIGARSAIYVSPLRAATLRGVPRPFAADNDESPDAVSKSLTITPRGYLLLAEGGAVGGGVDSTLTFYAPPLTSTDVGRRDLSAAPLMTAESGLRDIVAVAYAPQSGHLYAADFAADDPDQGGIYRIDDAGARGGRRVCRATKVAPVRFPTDMEFAADGSLWVITRGDPTAPPPASGEAADADGFLWRIRGPW